LGELTKLNEMDINLEEIKKFTKSSDRIIRLKAKLIPIEAILKIAKEIIEKNGFCTLKELNSELQKVYITNSRNKTVYFRFLLDISRSGLLNMQNIEYLDRKYINGKRFTNILITIKRLYRD
jgi:hypothetical protein